MSHSSATAARSVIAEAACPRPDKRSLIQDAAIKVFASHGYHGSRVSDIAQEAGIAYGLVYHYFKNKENLKLELVDLLIEKYESPDMIDFAHIEDDDRRHS